MKKCKSCQTEIDVKAKKCPNCKSDQRNWFARHKILTVILGLIVIGFIGGAGSSTQTPSTSTSNSKLAKPVDPIVVDTKSFGDEFDANQVAAEKKYKNKLVQFSSVISNITDTGLSFHGVSSKEFSLTQISCTISDKNALLSLKNGQMITVKGTVTGQSFGVIQLEDCSLVQ